MYYLRDVYAIFIIIFICYYVFLFYRSASLDVEPLYTFRSHTGPVLCLAMCSMGNRCYSGGLDGNIHCWTLPSANIDPYDSYEPSVLSHTLTGHTNAVWGLSMYLRTMLSFSADGTVKLWAPHASQPLLNTYISEQGMQSLSNVLSLKQCFIRS